MFSGMEQGEVDEAFRDQKDSVIFLIDCHKSMHLDNVNNGGPTTTLTGEENLSNVDQILQAALSFMKTKIITNDNDKIGIVLYGVGEANNSLNLNNIDVLMKLDTPDAQTIKQF